MPTDTAPRPPLGIALLISEVLRVFRSRFQEVFLVALLYSVVSLAVSLILVGPARTFGTGPEMGPEMGPGMGADSMGPGQFGPGAMPMMEFGVGDVLNGVLQILLSALFVAAMARLVVDVETGRRASAADYLQAAAACALPVALISILTGIATGLGLLLFVLPGLWIFAVLCVAIPAAAVEGAGLGALARSADLTRGYRWPIVGFGLVFVAVLLALTLVIGLVVLAPVALLVGGGEGLLGGLVLAIATAVVSAAYAGLGAIPAPVLYMRLRRLKGEGEPAGHAE